MRPSSPGRSGVRVALFAVLMLDSVVSGVFFPLSMLYLSVVAGVSLVQVGVLLTVAGVVSLPLPIWVGRLVDRKGAKNAVLVAQLLQAAGFAGYLVSWNPGTVLAAATVLSLGQRTFWASAFTLVSDISDRDPTAGRRERWFGIIGSLRAAGYGVGVLVAGLALAIGSRTALSLAILTCAVLLVGAAVVVHLAIPTMAAGSGAPEEIRGYGVLLKDRPYLALIALNSLFAICNIMLSIGLAPYVTRELPTLAWAIGPLLAMNTVVQAVFQTVVVRWIRPVRRDWSLCIAGALWAAWACLTLLPVWLAPAWWLPSLVVGVFCYSAAQLVHSPVSNALSADAAPADVRGRYLAVFQYSFAVAGVVTPVIFAGLFEISYGLPWIAVAVVGLSTIPFTVLLARNLPHKALATDAATAAK